MKSKPFSHDLQAKIDTLKAKRVPCRLGSIDFDSPLLLAPMSAICNAPFRQLMEDLGSGGTVSELISCHGINYGNDRTRRMLRLFETEKNVGIQLFGEDADAMAKASKVAEEFSPKFIDINMGCPVRKVVTKGGGSALLRDSKKLGHFFSTIKGAMTIPLTIKIRTGWDENSINAKEVIHIANEEGIEFVAIHGRTRTQQYTGQANWELLEELASDSPLPLIGNGDLHSSHIVKERMKHTKCQALMLGRGPLRNPFIFLESYLDDVTKSPFTPLDYLEIIYHYRDYLESFAVKERTILVQMRKIIVWFVAGFNGVAAFRGKIFECKDIEEVLKITEEFLNELWIKGQARKRISLTQPFMMGGHG